MSTGKTANFYHFIHTCALGFVSINPRPRVRTIATVFFCGGIVLFSGSLYGIVLLNERQPLAKVAPVGGVCFIAGWLVLGFL